MVSDEEDQESDSESSEYESDSDEYEPEGQDESDEEEIGMAIKLLVQWAYHLRLVRICWSQFLRKRERDVFAFVPLYIVFLASDDLEEHSEIESDEESDDGMKGTQPERRSIPAWKRTQSECFIRYGVSEWFMYCDLLPLVFVYFYYCRVSYRSRSEVSSSSSSRSSPQVDVVDGRGVLPSSVHSAVVDFSDVVACTVGCCPALTDEFRCANCSL